MEQFKVTETKQIIEIEFKKEQVSSKALFLDKEAAKEYFKLLKNKYITYISDGKYEIANEFKKTMIELILLAEKEGYILYKKDDFL